MSDHFPGEPGQDDAALAPELARLDELLLAEGRRWRRNEPSTARLERHVQALARPGVILPRNEERMLTERNQEFDTSVPRRTQQRPPARWRGPLAAVATVLLVAMAATVFAFLSGRSAGTGSGQRAAKATPTPGITHVTAIQPPNTFLPMPANAYLSDISLSSAHDGWAVGGIRIPDQPGQDFSSQRAVLVHYHDGIWTAASDSFPNISLDGVSMLSATDGWAVGQVVIASSATRPTDHYTGAVLFHFAGDGSGGHWQTVSAPALATLHPTTIRMFTPDSGYITGVVDVPATASGSMDQPGSVTQHVAVGVYQNGAWTLITTPFDYPNSQVVMVSASEGWASAQTFTQTGIYHYLSGVWTKSIALSDNIASLSAASSTDVWALAVKCLSCATPTHTSAVQQPLIYHYNGSTWTTLAPPNGSDISIPLGEDFTPTIFDDGPSGVWVSYVITEYSSGGWSSRTTMWRYNGRNAWESVSQPIKEGAIYTLTADGNGGMWAIVQTDTPFAIFVLYTQGNVWQVYGRSR